MTRFDGAAARKAADLGRPAPPGLRLAPADDPAAPLGVRTDDDFHLRLLVERLVAQGSGEDEIVRAVRRAERAPRGN
jgi:hypothetical protein